MRRRQNAALPIIKYVNIFGSCNGTEAQLYKLQIILDDDECGAIGRMIGRGTEVIGENLPQCCFVHIKSHMT
jgi:hypothetical protein